MPGSSASIRLYGEQVENLYVDLRGAPLRVQVGAEKTLRRSAKLIDAEMRIDATGHRHLSHLPTAVTHEMIDRYTAEIGLGPKRGSQGSLAHIIAYGSVNNAPVYDYTAGPRRAQPVVDEMFTDMSEKSVLGGEK